jgi:putative hydrolase of the HAD superfamily
LRRLARGWWRNVVAQTFEGLGSFSDFDAYFTELFAFFGDPNHWMADANAVAVLEELRAGGLTLGVLSNFDHRLYGILDGLDLRRYFDSVTISSEAGYAKPSPEVFAAAIARHGLKPPEALHVGDSEHHDHNGAMAAGIAVALIDSKVRDGLRISGRVARIASLGDVPQAAKELKFT